MIQSFMRALAQLPDSGMIKIIMQIIATTIGLILMMTLLSYFGFAYLGSLHDVQQILSFIELPAWVFENLTVVVFLILVICFPALSTIASGLFLDKVANIVEGKYYPQTVVLQLTPLLTSLLMAIKLLTLTLVLNIITLPLYFIPAINMIVFCGLNGYLIGREYYELVAQRHLPGSEMGVFRKQKMKSYFVFGAIVTFLMTIPLLNLLMPIIATAAMVHLFHKAWGK